METGGRYGGAEWAGLAPTWPAFLIRREIVSAEAAQEKQDNSEPNS